MEQTNKKNTKELVADMAWAIALLFSREYASNSIPGPVDGIFRPEDNTAISQAVPDADWDMFYKTIDIAYLPPPAVSQNGMYGQFIAAHGLGFQDRLLLGLALVHSLNPGMLSQLLHRDRFVGRYASARAGQLRLALAKGLYLPTGITFAYLMGGDNAIKKAEAVFYIDRHCPLIKSGTVFLMDNGLPGAFLAQPLAVDESLLPFF